VTHYTSFVKNRANDFGATKIPILLVERNIAWQFFFVKKLFLKGFKRSVGIVNIAIVDLNVLNKTVV
jgi:hypothetical protein